MTDDFITDDILGNDDSKKKKNSKSKGKRGEAAICDLLAKRFPNEKFSRVVGSGARGYQVNLTEEAKQVMTGDIVVPATFRFCIEVKNGYPEIDLCSALEKGHTKIDAFLNQASRDAERINKKPLLLWKKDRQPWLAFIKKTEAINLIYCLGYRDWLGVSFTQLLEQQESFWLVQPCSK